MNRWQLAKQLQYLLRARAWTGGTDKVFMPTAVRIVAAASEALLERAARPACFLWVLGGENDPEAPGFGKSSIGMRVYTARGADAFGEGAMLGQNRSTTGGQGRGLLEIEREIMAAIDDLSAVNGITLFNRAESAVASDQAEIPGGVMAEYHFEAKTTREPYYPPVSRMTATSGGVGLLSAAWTATPDRYDRLSYVARRSAAGGSAPASVSDGVAMTVAGVTASASGLASGTYAVSIFASYDDLSETSPGTYAAATARNYSQVISKTGITVA